MFRSRRPAADEVWEGVVVNKSRNMPDGSSMYYYVTVQFTDGDTKKIRIDRDLWESLSEDEGIVKVAGQDPARR